MPLRFSLAVAFAAMLLVPSSGMGAARTSTAPDFGPNVTIFDPSMPQSDIQARLDAISAAQLSNEFGPQRYAVLFRPGTYCSDASPLNFQVGYYEQVAAARTSARRRRRWR